MAEQEPRWLDPVEWHAWRNYIAGQALLAGRLNRELSDRHGLSLADYEIDPAGTKRVHSVNVRGFESLPTTVTVR